jgi:hypothetical protein
MALIKYGSTTEPHNDINTLTELMYKKEYAIEKFSGGERLIISPENEQIDMMLNLLGESNNSQYGILYILLVSRCGNKLGRYQIANSVTFDELKLFCKKYSKYLETDGRHHFWIINHNTKDLVIYDQHNVLYAYENPETKINILEKINYKRVEKIFFSTPHCHCYNEENDIFEIDIIKNNEWIVTALTAQDSTPFYTRQVQTVLI